MARSMNKKQELIQLGLLTAKSFLQTTSRYFIHDSRFSVAEISTPARREDVRKIITGKMERISQSRKRFIESLRKNHSSAHPENIGESISASKAIPESSAAAAPRRPIRNGPVTWGSLGLLILTGSGLIYYYDSEKKKRLAAVRQSRPVGKAAIGGPFALVDQNGKPTTDQDLKGAWNLLYFGFTYCPDICPEELEKLAAAVDIVEKRNGLKVRPVFVSIDPERDTVDQVREYVKEFHPRLLGLTGNVEAVRSAAREYRVYYMKTEEEGDDYLVDHSIIMYLMDPNMEFVKFFGKNYTVEGLADGIIEEVKNWKDQDKQ